MLVLLSCLRRRIEFRDASDDAQNRVSYDNACRVERIVAHLRL